MFFPPEIVFLRSSTPSPFPHMDTPEIVYDILEGNVQNSFDIIKRLDHGMIVGECHCGMWLTMPADHRPSLEAFLSGNHICIKWFSDLISHYERFSCFFFRSLNKTKCICVSLREERGEAWIYTERLIQSNSFRQCDSDLMIGLKSRRHHLWPFEDARPCVVHPEPMFFLHYKHVALFPTFVARPTLMCSLSTHCFSRTLWKAHKEVFWCPDGYCWCAFTQRLLGRATILSL